MIQRYLLSTADDGAAGESNVKIVQNAERKRRKIVLRFFSFAFLRVNDDFCRRQRRLE